MLRIVFLVGLYLRAASGHFASTFIAYIGVSFAKDCYNNEMRGVDLRRKEELGPGARENGDGGL